MENVAKKIGVSTSMQVKQKILLCLNQDASTGMKNLNGEIIKQVDDLILIW